MPADAGTGVDNGLERGGQWATCGTCAAESTPRQAGHIPVSCYSPGVPEPDKPDDFVTLTRVGDWTTAQLLRGRLDADGIACFLPDEVMARQLQPAVRGIRVQVRRADLERAREILAEPGVAETDPAAEARPEGAAPPATPAEGDGDASIGAGDRAGFRALRVALASLWLMGLMHPYSLWLAVRALGRDDITAWGRRRAGIALVISVAGCVWVALVASHLARLGP